MTNYKLSEFLNLVFETPQGEFTEWFGYYNYDPLNSRHDKMLMNRALFEDVPIESGMKIDVGYYNLIDSSWHKLGTTDSFNWQQGAMLQWLPSKNNDTEVIYNFSDKISFKSCIINIETGVKKIIDYPIYAIFPDGKRALGLNYERLYWCRAYHYQSIKNPRFDVQVPSEDGIYLINLDSNKSELLIDINDVIGVDADPDFNEARHWIEHVMLSPNGEKFCFLHRFSYGNVMSYGTRLCIANSDGSNIQVIDGWRKFGWSHFGWCGNNAFSIYTYVAPKILKQNSKPGLTPNNGLKTSFFNVAKKIAKVVLPHSLLNKLVGKTSYYQFYMLNNNRFKISDCFGEKYLSIDGHPSFTKDGRYMITDTYPDRKRRQRLIIVNVSNHKSLVLGTFDAPLMGRPSSCDLHPKLSRDNNYVSIDTAHTGKHQMMLFKLDWAKIINKIG